MKLLFNVACVAALTFTLDALAETTLPVYGKWDCEIMDFTLDAETYVVSDYEMKVKSIGKVDDDAYVAEMTDGYRIGLFEVGPKSLIWHSSETGDTFDCKRVSK